MLCANEIFYLKFPTCIAHCNNCLISKLSRQPKFGHGAWWMCFLSAEKKCCYQLSLKLMTLNCPRCLGTVSMILQYFGTFWSLFCVSYHIVLVGSIFLWHMVWFILYTFIQILAMYFNSNTGIFQKIRSTKYFKKIYLGGSSRTPCTYVHCHAHVPYCVPLHKAGNASTPHTNVFAQPTKTCNRLNPFGILINIQYNTLILSQIQIANPVIVLINLVVNDAPKCTLDSFNETNLLGDCCYSCIRQCCLIFITFKGIYSV